MYDFYLIQSINIFRVLFVFVALICLPVSVATAQQVVESDGDLWTMRCEEEGPQAGQCEIYQRLVLTDSGRRVSEFAIGFPEGRDSGRGVIILPLGTVLTDGIAMKIDEGPAFSFRPRYCVPDGCYAFLSLSGQVLDSLKRGYEAEVTFSTIGGQDARLQFSLAGLTAALREMGR